MTQRAWTEALLDEMRHEGDALADAVIAEVERAGTIERVNQVLQHLVRNDDVIPDRALLPAVVCDYLERNDSLPDGVDLARVRNGQRVYFDHAPQMAWLLTCASLPTCYACEKGARVLALSERISSPQLAHRRIFETAQFVLDVMAPGGLEPGGRGLRSIQKVRLMHAAIRRYIGMARDGRWPAAWGPPIAWDASAGEPINQEDLANTLLSFSVTVLNGLDKLGDELDARDAEDYLYVWGQIGRLIGVRPELIANDRAEAQALLETICGRHWQAGPAGAALTRTLLAFAQQLVPGKAFDGLVAATIRLCFEDDSIAGKNLCDILPIPRSDVTEALLRGVVRSLDVAEDLLLRTPFAQLFTDRWNDGPLFELAGKILIQGYLDLERGGARPAFRIPASLRDRFER